MPNKKNIEEVKVLAKSLSKAKAVYFTDYHGLNVGDITKYTSPLKLFDYLCAGKIIICSDYDVLKEIIKNKKNAIFVKNYKNPYSWKNEILKLENQSSKQLIMSRNNYLLSKKFSLKQRAKSILNSVI